ncbi:hypothetical protein WT31_29745 [Burkholderia territorii]|nr:hypothetical protein WT31_29745 [Burkholderia territorii]
MFGGCGSAVLAAFFPDFGIALPVWLWLGVSMRSPFRWAVALTRAIQLATRPRCAQLEVIA